MSVTPCPSYSERAGFELISEIALKVAMSGSILPMPDVCLVIVIAFGRGTAGAKELDLCHAWTEATGFRKRTFDSGTITLRYTELA
jgi:hypothetical protein